MAARILQGIALVGIVVMPLAMLTDAFGMPMLVNALALIGHAPLRSFVSSQALADIESIAETLVPGLLLWYIASRAAKGNAYAVIAEIIFGLPAIIWSFIEIARIDPGELSADLIYAIPFYLAAVVLTTGALAQWELSRVAQRDPAFAALLAFLDAPQARIPPSVAPRARARAFVLFAVAGVSWFLAVVEWMLITAVQAIAAWAQSRNADSMASLYEVGVAVSFLKLPLFLVFTFLGGLAYRFGRRAQAARVDELRKSDPRRPILFLRSFRDDAIRIKRTFKWENFFGGWRTGLTLESVIAEATWRVGPVVAIGRPGELLPRLGAAREYVRDDQWQGVVARFSHEAIATIAVAGITEGIRWEYEHLEREGLLERLILIVPPASRAVTRRRLAIVSEVLGSRSGALELQESPRLIAVGFTGNAVLKIECRGRDESAYGVASTLLLTQIAQTQSARDLALLDSGRLRPRVGVFIRGLGLALAMIVGAYAFVRVAPANPDDANACRSHFGNAVSTESPESVITAADAAAGLTRCEQRYGLADLSDLAVLIGALAAAEHAYRLAEYRTTADSYLGRFTEELRVIASNPRDSTAVRGVAKGLAGAAFSSQATSSWHTCFEPLRNISGYWSSEQGPLSDLGVVGNYNTSAAAVDSFRKCSAHYPVPSVQDVEQHFLNVIKAAQLAENKEQFEEAKADVAALRSEIETLSREPINTPEIRDFARRRWPQFVRGAYGSNSCARVLLDGVGDPRNCALL
jgi:hypothetical protein